MTPASVRWSLRLPWSSAQRVQLLVQKDAPGRVGEVVARAISQLLDQPEPTILALIAHIVTKRGENPRDRTQICSWRVDSTLITRCTRWCETHPTIAASWLVDAAIRCYASLCESRQGGAIPGLQARRYHRLCADLVVLVDDEAHAA